MKMSLAGVDSDLKVERGPESRRWRLLHQQLKFKFQRLRKMSPASPAAQRCICNMRDTLQTCTY